jgi:hypothetical protein
MSAPDRMDFADGKYTVINDNGSLTALRNGEPWGRDLIGDNLVYWMLVEALNLKEQRDELLAALAAVQRTPAWEHTSISVREPLLAAITKAEGKS